MPTIIRPIQADDYAPAAALASALEPERAALATNWQAADASTNDMGRAVGYVALAGDPPEVRGYGSFWRVRMEQYRLELMVHPAWRRQGMGGRLLRQMLDDLALRGASSIQARADEENLEAQTFLWRNGFVETQRMYRMRLDLATPTPERWRAIEAQLASQGITISTLAYERAHDHAALHKLYDLHTAALDAWPNPDPGPNIPPSFGEYARRFEQSTIIPEGFFIARQAGIYVGYSGLAYSASAPQQLQTVGTAVRPALRRHGIATALKLRVLDFARQRGYTSLITHTASPTLLALNLRLGFRRERAEVRLVLTLSS